MKETTTTINLTEINRFTVPNEPCVYIITNLVNQKVYVGSSKALYSRIKYTLSCLKRSKRLPKEMLADYKRFGPESFTFTFEVMEKNLISSVEKLTVALNKDRGVYNIYYAGKSRDSKRNSKGWEQIETIRYLRHKEGLKIQDIAKAVGTSYTTAWRILHATS